MKLNALKVSSFVIAKEGPAKTIAGGNEGLAKTAACANDFVTKPCTLLCSGDCESGNIDCLAVPTGVYCFSKEC